MRNASIEFDPARGRAVLEAELGHQLLSLGREAVETLGGFRTALGTIVVEDAALRWLDARERRDAARGGRAARRERHREDGGADDRFALRVEARPPDSGPFHAEGESALFAALPPPMDLSFEVEELSLSAFAPLAERARLDVKRGVASARGRLQLAGRSLRLDLSEASLAAAEFDWRHTAPTWTAEGKALKAAGRPPARAVRGRGTSTSPPSGWRSSARRFGVRDASADPPYRVFVIVESAALSGLLHGARKRPGDVGRAGPANGHGPLRRDRTLPHRRRRSRGRPRSGRP